MSKRTKLFVRDPAGDDVGEVKRYAHADMVLRDQDVSSWSIAGIPNSRLIRLADPGSSLVVERDGEELIAGPLDLDEREWGDGYDDLILSGYDDDIHLWDRLVFPSAKLTNAGLSFANAAYHVVPPSGLLPAETVMKEFVLCNAVTGGAWTAGGRGVPGLTLAPDLGRGEGVVGRGRFQVLGELLVELALAGGDLGFGVKNNEFDVYEHRDVSEEVVFSKELKNLYGYRLKRQAPTGMFMLVGGGGEETARVFAYGGDADAAELWGRRIEVFRDRRDTTEIAELQQTIAEEAFAAGEIFEVELRPRDTNRAQFLTGYRLGDTVTVAERKCVMRTVKLTLDEKGETIEPTPSLTSQNADALLEIFDSVRNVQKQVSALQRSI